LTEAWTERPPPNPLGGGSALSVVVACNEYSAPFDLDHKLAKRTAEFERRLAELAILMASAIAPLIGLIAINLRFVLARADSAPSSERASHG
jgi:hypothetical protein